MGTQYAALCFDCKKYVDLYKFYGWSITNAEEFREWYADDSGYMMFTFVEPAFKLVRFLAKHNGHRVAVYDEHKGEYEDAVYGDEPGWEEENLSLGKIDPTTWRPKGGE